MTTTTTTTNLIAGAEQVFQRRVREVVRPRQYPLEGRRALLRRLVQGRVKEPEHEEKRNKTVAEPQKVSGSSSHADILSSTKKKAGLLRLHDCDCGFPTEVWRGFCYM